MGEKTEVEKIFIRLAQSIKLINLTKFQLKLITLSWDDAEQMMKLDWLYEVGSEYELKSWPDSSVGYGVWTELSGYGFKSHWGQPSIANSFKESLSGDCHIYYIYYTIYQNTSKMHITMEGKLSFETVFRNPAPRHKGAHWLHHRYYTEVCSVTSEPTQSSSRCVFPLRTHQRYWKSEWWT